MSFELAGQRAARLGRPGRVTLVDKANVFRAFAWLRQIFEEIAAEYPDVRHDAAYVDAMALDMIRPPLGFRSAAHREHVRRYPLGPCGGADRGHGFAPSADLGEAHAVFQPSHGTAPDIAGQGKANPTATILSAAMMLDWLAMRGAGSRLSEAAEEIRQAVDAAFLGGLRTADVGGSAGTVETTRVVLEALS